MAIDQRTADCLGEAAAFRPSARRHARPGDLGDRDPGLSPGQATHLNEQARPALQHLVDELARTEPSPERTYELACVASHGIGRVTHCVLLCTDRRVVYAETEAGAGVLLLAPFPHGVLDVQNKLLKLRPELEPGPRPVLVWPRVAGDDDVLDLGVRQIMAEPSPNLRALLDRLGRDAWSIPLVATPQAPPPAWHPDPTGRHQQRWWDGTRWTEHVADAGASGADPI
jgi:hypothetical protein